MDQKTISNADMAAADIPLPLARTTIQTGHLAEVQDHGHDHDHPHHDHDEHDHPLQWVDLVRIGLVALAVLASWLRLWQPAQNSAKSKPATWIAVKSLDSGTRALLCFHKWK